MAQSARPYVGVSPVAPTPFAADGTLDLNGQRRVLDCSGAYSFTAPVIAET